MDEGARPTPKCHSLGRLANKRILFAVSFENALMVSMLTTESDRKVKVGDFGAVKRISELIRSPIVRASRGRAARLVYFRQFRVQFRESLNWLSSNFFIFG